MTSPPPQRLSADVPQRVGRYRLLRKLGQGGMGAVYEAVHTKLQSRVALKLLPRELAEKPEAVARFEREMRAVGRVSHPGIVQAHDADEADGHLYLAMELVDGDDLADVVRGIEFAATDGQIPVPSADDPTDLTIERTRMPIAAACEVIRQAALAMQHAHEAGLVHRDLKPANLMLSRDGIVKVLDLGLARIEGEITSTATDITSPDQVMGTVDYMAPEQAAAGAPVDARADVYALAATLYRLISGQSAFDTARYDSLLRKLAALATDAPPPLPLLRGDCSEALAAVIEAAMAKNADDRTATAGELAAALEPFASATELQAVAVTLPERPPIDDPSDITVALDDATDDDTRPDVTVSDRTVVGDETAGISRAQTMTVGAFSLDPASKVSRRRSSKPIAAIALVAAVLIGLVALFATRGGDAPSAGDASLAETVESSQNDSPQESADAAARSGSSVASRSKLAAPPDAVSVRTGLRLVSDQHQVATDWELPIAGPFTIEATVIPDFAFEEKPPRIGTIVSAGDSVSMNRYGPNWGGYVNRDRYEVGRRDYHGETLHNLKRGKRTRLAFVATETQWSLFVNGVRAISEPATRTNEGDRRVYIGRRSLGIDRTTNVHPFAGIIEEVRFSGTARYDADHEPPKTLTTDSDTLALYTFDEGAGTVVHDSSGNGRHGTLTGGQWVAAEDQWPQLTRGGLALYDYNPAYENRTLMTIEEAGTRAQQEIDVDRRHHVTLPVKRSLEDDITLEAIVVPTLADQTGQNISRMILSLNGDLSLKTYNQQWDFMCNQSFFSPDWKLNAEESVAMGRRVHVAGTQSGTTMLLHVDGTLKKRIIRTPREDGKPIPPRSSARLGLLAYPFMFRGTAFPGIIEEVRISSVPRYDDSDFEPPSTFVGSADDDTIALYDLTEDNGDMLKDRSGNGHDAVCTVGQWVRPASD